MNSSQFKGGWPGVVQSTIDPISPSLKSRVGVVRTYY